MGDPDVNALRRAREDVLRFCGELGDDEWGTSSRAPGWTVQDVVAHLGASCQALFTRDVVKLLHSRDIEASNEVLVARHRHRDPAQVLDHYRRWSGRAVAAATTVRRTPVRALQLPLAELGRFRAGLLMTGAMVFDHHTHLHYDIAPALERSAPPADDAQMSLVSRWMFAVLANQLLTGARDRPTRRVDIFLRGAGGGRWSVTPYGAVQDSESGSAAATISASTRQFPEWATCRVSWRARDVRIQGDEATATRFLDSMRIV